MKKLNNYKIERIKSLSAEGLNHVEIAEVLNVSYVTVGKYLKISQKEKEGGYDANCVRSKQI